MSLLHGVSFNNKGKLIWTKSLQDLQKFVEEILNLADGGWCCPGGSAKQFKSEDIDLRLYPETQTITLNGKLKDEIGEILNSAALISGKLANLGVNDSVSTPPKNASLKNINDFMVNSNLAGVEVLDLEDSRAISLSDNDTTNGSFLACEESISCDEESVLQNVVKSFYSASKPKKEHFREANLSQISILLENSMVSREQALPIFMQAEINNEIVQSVSPPGNVNATSDLENNKSETQSIEQFKPTTITAATTTTTKAIHKKGEKNRAGQNRTMRNKGKLGNKVNNDNDNSRTHSLKPKQKGEIKINKNNTPPTSNNHREISEIASVNKDRFKDNQTQLVVTDTNVPSNTLSNVKKMKAHKLRSKIVSLPPNWLGNLPLIDLPSPINRTVEGSHSHVDERPNYFSRYGRKRRPPGWQVYLNFVSRHTQYRKRNTRATP